MHQFTPLLSPGMEVGVLQGPGKVKGLQQECEDTVRSEKDVSAATDVLLRRVVPVLLRVVGKRSIARLSNNFRMSEF